MRGAGPRAAALALAVLLLAGCAASPDEAVTPSPQGVTAEQAQLIAIARFRSFDAGSRPFTTDLTERGTALHLQGWIDYPHGSGYVSVTSRGASFDPQALLWSASTVGITPAAPDAAGDPPLPVLPLSDSRWTSRPMDPASSRMDALLSAITALGADRPDNPLLVQQAGGLWLRADTVDGVPVQVFATPPSDEPLGVTSPPVTADSSPVRLWLDASGLILRAELRLGDDWSTVAFGTRTGADLPDMTSTGGAR